MVLSSSKAHNKKKSALLRYLSWRYPSMDEGVVNSNPPFQAADILTLKKPQWDVLSDKMKYVIQESVDIDGHGKNRHGYQVFAYSKVPMRKTAWLTLFGVKKDHNGCGTDAIRGKFEDYEPFKECKQRPIVLLLFLQKQNL